MIDWRLETGSSDDIADLKDLSNGWYLPERRIAADAPTLAHAIKYIMAGLAKFGIVAEWRLRQPLSFSGPKPVVLMFAANFDQNSFGQATRFSWNDACQTAWAGDTSVIDGPSSTGPYSALAVILIEWGIPVTAEQMPPFHPLGTSVPDGEDPVGEKKKDASNIHFEVSAAFNETKWPYGSLFTRILPDGNTSAFRRTTFATSSGFSSVSRPGWRQER